MSETPGERFAGTLKFLVAHRGLPAEQELIEFLGLDRLKQIYDGQEPRFGEFIEIARILRVPLSAFQIAGPGEMPELEIAFAEILYAGRRMSVRERARLARAMRDILRPDGNASAAEAENAPPGRASPRA